MVIPLGCARVQRRDSALDGNTWNTPVTLSPGLMGFKKEHARVEIISQYFPLLMPAQQIDHLIKAPAGYAVLRLSIPKVANLSDLTVP